MDMARKKTATKKRPASKKLLVQLNDQEWSLLDAEVERLSELSGRPVTKSAVVRYLIRMGLAEGSPLPRLGPQL